MSETIWSGVRELYLSVLKFGYEFVKAELITNDYVIICIAISNMKPWDVEDYIYYHL